MKATYARIITTDISRQLLSVFVHRPKKSAKTASNVCIVRRCIMWLCCQHTQSEGAVLVPRKIASSTSADKKCAQPFKGIIIFRMCSVVCTIHKNVDARQMRFRRLTKKKIHRKEASENHMHSMPYAVCVCLCFFFPFDFALIFHSSIIFLENCSMALLNFCR